MRAFRLEMEKAPIRELRMEASGCHWAERDAAFGRGRKTKRTPQSEVRKSGAGPACCVIRSK